MKQIFLIIICILQTLTVSAQIGYQVSLLNNATGEARANERVTVTVKITDSKGTIVCEETKNETSNDFGVISMCVGDSETFANADWSKLPFFIEASVDGRLLGKSQLLSVPVAEYAKKTGQLSIDILCSKVWNWYSSWGTDHFDDETYYFKDDGTYTLRSAWEEGESYQYGIYYIDGNNVYISADNSIYVNVFFYSPVWNRLIESDGFTYK